METEWVGDLLRAKKMLEHAGQRSAVGASRAKSPGGRRRPRSRPATGRAVAELHDHAECRDEAVAQAPQFAIRAVDSIHGTLVNDSPAGADLAGRVKDRATRTLLLGGVATVLVTVSPPSHGSSVPARSIRRRGSHESSSTEPC